jgi:pimeloyl-ACP methyl ester carboxylesterase
MDLEVTELGRGDALIVFVHGVLDTGRSFRRVAELLASDCRMLCYDRRGYGASGGDAVDPVGVDGHVTDLLAVLDGRRAVVVGHSFGGVTAMGAAVRAPELVDALVLYESVTAWVPAWDDRIVRGVLGSADPEEAALGLMFGERYASLSDAERARFRVEARAFVAEESSVRTGTAPFDLAEVRAPIVYGASSPERLAPVLDNLRALTRIEVVDVPGAGHNAHRSAPEAFAGLVRRGLELARDRDP